MLWNQELQFLSVYKENLQNNSKFHCVDNATALTNAGKNKPGCPLSWPCNKPAGVRELLGLGPPYYFKIIPASETGATKYDVEWQQLQDPLGFKATFGPTTAERRSPCFNQTMDSGE